MKQNDSMRVVRRLYASLVPVQALAVGLPGINTLLSSILVGNFLGEDALAAVGFAGPLQLCISAVARTFSGGVQIIAGKALGRGDRSALSRVFNTAMGLCVLFGALCCVLCCSLSDGLALIQGAVGENTETTAAFVRGLGVGIGFSAMSACVFLFLQLERMDRVSTILSVAMMVVNVGGNAVNVFFLHWGLFGAGLFLSVSNLVAVIVGLPWVLCKGKLFRLDLSVFRWREAWEIIRLGSPNAVISLVGMVRKRVMNQYVFLLGGNVAMAALSVAGNFTTALGCVVQAGYSGSCEVVSGMLLGQRDVKSLRKMPETMVKSVGWMFAAAYLLVFVLTKPFALLMGALPEHLAVYALVIRVYNLWYFVSLLTVPPREIYEMLGKAGLICVLNIVSGAVIPALLCILLAQRVGLWLPASTNMMADVVQILFFTVYFRAKAHRLPRSPFELCYIPSSLSVPREDRYDAVVATTEDAVAVSRGAVDFCKARGLDGKIANYCGLCIEELAVDAVQNRFSGKKATLDVRMLYEDGHIRILFRDDCRHFDPNEWLALCTPEDASRSIGIRMVSKLAGRMEYNSTLGLNVLTVEL